MGQAIMVEASCDAANCTNVVRTWHWASIAAVSQLRAALHHAGWLTIKTAGKHNTHYCPSHKADPAEAWDASSKRAERAQAWVKDGSRCTVNGGQP